MFVLLIEEVDVLSLSTTEAQTKYAILLSRHKKQAIPLPDDQFPKEDAEYWDGEFVGGFTDREYDSKLCRFLEREFEVPLNSMGIQDKAECALSIAIVVEEGTIWITGELNEINSEQPK
ncbi:hypothetical protein [Vibrio sp.]|uniref:hypothetical protein n=1 Tax=Vibrio sp. TaxID=678 RepID=UPI003D0BF42A